MPLSLQSLVFYCGVIGLAICLGGILPLFQKWHHHHIPKALSFAAGVMLGSTFFHLLPDSYELLGKAAAYYLLFGFLVLYFIERFITIHICETFNCEVHHIGISAFIGIAIHNLISGIALGSGLMLPGLGFVVFVAIAAHKMPESFSLTTILLHTKIPRNRIMWVHLSTWFMVPIGALLALWLIQVSNATLIGKAIGFSAGTFLYIALSDLLPEVHKHSTSKFASLVFMLLGLVLMWVLERQF